MGDDLSPQIAVRISGIDLRLNALEFVQSVKVEQAKDKADLVTIVLANPFRDKIGERRTSELLWTESLAFQPGNVVEVFLSYGNSEPELVGAGIIRRWMPNFPRTGVPTITIKAFDGSCLMMDGTDEVVATRARSYDAGVSLTDMVLNVFQDYGIRGDIHVEPVNAEPAVPTAKKSGMKDYTFVRGLANLVGHDFYVDWDLDHRQWIGHWEVPFVNTGAKRRFVWGPDFADGDGDGILLDFSPEFTIQGASTDVEAYYLDRDTKTWEQIIYPEEGPSEDKQEYRWAGDDTTVEADLQAMGNSFSGRSIRVKAGGTSVEVLPANGFQSAEEALSFARDWWKARAALLIQGGGTLVGWPKLRPGQLHEFGGLGPGLSGPWYIAECTHEWSRGGAYFNRVLARKIIP